MSLTITKSKTNSPLCEIKDGENDGIKIYVNTDIKQDEKKSKLKRDFTELKINDGSFQQIPNTNQERDVIMVSGQSGSGKSYYINNYLKEYRKAYKKNDIYMFSNLKSDKTLKDSEKHITRINIDNEILTDPINVEDFKNSLVLFDDIDVIKDKKLREAVYAILNEILETGRHFNVSCIMTVHYPNKANIRTMLNECHSFVYFPWGAIKSTYYVLENYLGVDKNIIKKIKKTKSRFACVYRSFPQPIITEREIFLLTNEE